MVCGGLEITLHEVAIDRRGCCSNFNAVVGLTISIVRTLITMGTEVEIHNISVQHTVCRMRFALAWSSRCIYQQITSLVVIGKANNTIIIEQWRIEPVSTLASLIISFMMSSKVNSRHARIGLFPVVARFRCWLRVGCKIDRRIEVGHTHLLTAIVGWCTIDAITLVCTRQTATALHDRRRHFLMRSQIIPTVCQRLSEEEIIVRPNRSELDDVVIICIFDSILSYIIRSRNTTISVTEVTVSITLLNISCRAKISVAAIMFCLPTQRTLICFVETLIIISRVYLLVTVTLIEVEAIQIVSHLTIVEGSAWFLCRHILAIGERSVQSRFAIFLIIAVDYLTIGGSSGITK